MEDKERVIDIEPRHEKILKEILEKYLSNKTVWAYGSRVKWTATKVSDLDLTVFGASEKQIYDAKEVFEESSLPFRVSLMAWEDMPEEFKDNIREKYVVLIP
ncbi:MAG: hypothetical protein CSA15_07340 [Candidatus Delongbacteria bacterium]|nr:MAG: hypothetical protein CSA15_07340 [Candidatus Delongbacteria bacterium]